LRRILHGLSIPHIGKKTAQMIQEAYATFCTTQKLTSSLQTLIDFMSNEELLSSIYGIGKEIIQGSQTFFALPATRHVLTQLDQLGVRFDQFDAKSVRQGPLSGMSFCITGTFALSRETIISILESQGATFSPNITKNLTFLLVGKNPSSKLSKAQDLNIKILTLDELSTFAP
jgi:DNA ligase (NAD+)